MERNILLTPGPTMIPQEAREALARPIIHHRTPQFQQNIKDAIAGLQYVFQTKNEIYLLASSGTGAMEAAVCNLLSPGDKAITVEGGKFGERWTELCHAYGANPLVIQVEWGKAVEPKQIKEVLDKNKGVKAVFITQIETSTGVLTDIKAVADVVKKTDAVLVVDSVSGLGVNDLKTDAWGVDVVASASHKGFMLPPGLAFISVNAKAYKLIEQSKNRRYYFDLRASKKAFAATDTPFTPAIGIVIGLVESLNLIKKAGLDKWFARQALLAKATREAVKALGLTMYTHPSCLANALTAVNVPQGIDGEKLVKTLRDVHGITMAGGQAELKGKIFRIAHMGCVSEQDILTGISFLERVLGEMNHRFIKGAGVKAAEDVFHTKEIGV
ncbi:MAG TPA: alanine--glyoxylate aminotransferase family protein [Candidatus Omnitrophota bacterium]|nr:alanine--glyoxylate aminotransferase family protein [Candidatus Omnitrophota bacterium]